MPVLVVVLLARAIDCKKWHRSLRKVTVAVFPLAIIQRGGSKVKSVVLTKEGGFSNPPLALDWRTEMSTLL